MPGHLELLILGLLCGLFVLVPLIVVLVVLSLNRGQRASTAQPCPKCGMVTLEQGSCLHCDAPLDATD